MSVAFSSYANGDESVVKVVRTGQQFQLIRNGQPYAVKGVGGDSHLDLLKSLGGNSIRTWSADKLGSTLEAAEKRGLTVCAGLWLGHPRHGFSYQDAAAVKQQMQQKLAYVRQHKDHPSLLIWGVGNEMEGEGNDPNIWKAVNELAREIKKVDPNHPTMTVIAELGEGASKIRNIERYCPDIDIIGINSYGGVESISKRIKVANSSKPYIVTEHGPLGPWEIGKTAWGSPVEWTSTQKADFYRKGYVANVQNNSQQCLGSYAFLWGNKQETTATWFGMLLPDGKRLAAVDIMSELWTGNPVKNQVPRIESLKVSQSAGLNPGDRITAELKTNDPDADELQIQWILRSDSGTIGAGGDRQQAENDFSDAVQSNGSSATVVIPDSYAAYRLFAYVFDAHGGAAVANVALGLKIDPKNLPTMPAAKLPYVVYGDQAAASVYVPSGYMGKGDAIEMDAKSTDAPYEGATCLKVQYTAKDAWGGVLWQSPAEDWDGKLPGGANLAKATQLEFYARGAKGGEVVNFVFGVLDGNQPYRDTAKGELKDMKLTTEWNKYTIPLRGLDLSRIKTGFGWSLAGQGEPVTFYLDNIRYVQED